MPTITGLQVITRAAGDLNLIQLGETMDSDMAADLLVRLNEMMGQLAQDGATAAAIARVVLPLIAGKGSSTNPYTIGLGGDFNTIWPANQSDLLDAGLLLNVSTPPIEIPRAILTDDAWAKIRIKDLTNTLFTSVYYRPDYQHDLGSVFLWPVPTDLTNSIVLYIQSPLTTFADLTTIYSVPRGYDAMLHYNLAVELGIPYGRDVTPKLEKAAARTLATVQRSNMNLVDIANDFRRLGQRGDHGYNILTGEGG